MISRREFQRTEVREKMRGGNGQVTMRALIEGLPKGTRLFSALTLRPGDSIGYHTHEGETEYYYFVQGLARVSDNGELFTVSAGDAMCTPSCHGHSVENVGDEDVVLVAVIVLDSPVGEAK